MNCSQCGRFVYRLYGETNVWTPSTAMYCVDCEIERQQSRENSKSSDAREGLTIEDKRATRLTTHDMFRLNRACEMIARTYRAPYLVGSALRGTFRDVDVRLILEDEEFDSMFAGATASEQCAKWELLSLAIGDYLRRETGLPIDFQIQRRSEANARHSGPRNPLGLVSVFAGAGDGTPFVENTVIEGEQ